MAKNLFIIYFLVSFILCAFFTLVKNYQMPFDYEQIFEVSEILYFSSFLFVGIFFFILGYNFTKLKEPRDINQEIKITLQGTYKYRYFFLFTQLLIIVYFSSKLLSGSEYENGEQYLKNYRPLGDKISTFLLLAQSGLVILLSRKFIDRSIVILCAVFISFIFAWVDASRASILPIIGILYICYSRLKYFQFAFYSMILILFYMMAIVGRSYIDRIGYGALTEIITHTITSFDEILVWVVSYFTAFSIFQFSYVTRDSLGEFTAYDLYYSILPIPSFFWSVIPDYENWRADEFRPMGAVSEVFRVSQFYMYCYFFIVGVLAKLVDKIEFKLLRLLGLAIFLMTGVMMFQYNLRTVQWFYYLLIFIYFYDHFIFKNKVHK